MSGERRATEIADRLGIIIEAVDELAFDALRSAAEEGTGRPDLDRRLVQARRALEKARHILNSIDA